MTPAYRKFYTACVIVSFLSLAMIALSAFVPSLAPATDVDRLDERTRQRIYEAAQDCETDAKRDAAIGSVDGAARFDMEAFLDYWLACIDDILAQEGITAEEYDRIVAEGIADEW